MTNLEEILDQLKEPFDPNAISWRVGNTNKKSQPDGKATKGIALAYIDARDVMDRLDMVVGADSWQDNYVETTSGRVICNLSIKLNGEWITKSDGAGDTDVEGEKGAISDAFKRAAVKFGIGRYLYSLPNKSFDLENGYSFSNETRKQLLDSLPEWAKPGSTLMLQIGRQHRQVFKYYSAALTYINCDDGLGLNSTLSELTENFGEKGYNLVWGMLDTNDKDKARKLLETENTIGH